MVTRHRRQFAPLKQSATMTPEQLTRTLEDFLASAQNAVILEDGAVLFDLSCPNIPSRENTTNACCISGLRSAMLCAASSKPK